MRTDGSKTSSLHGGLPADPATILSLGGTRFVILTVQVRKQSQRQGVGGRQAACPCHGQQEAGTRLGHLLVTGALQTMSRIPPG